MTEGLFFQPRPETKETKAIVQDRPLSMQQLAQTAQELLPALRRAQYQEVRRLALLLIASANLENTDIMQPYISNPFLVTEHLMTALNDKSAERIEPIFKRLLAEALHHYLDLSLIETFRDKAAKIHEKTKTHYMAVIDKAIALCPELHLGTRYELDGAKEALKGLQDTGSSYAIFFRILFNILKVKLPTVIEQIGQLTSKYHHLWYLEVLTLRYTKRLASQSLEFMEELQNNLVRDDISKANWHVVYAAQDALHYVLIHAKGSQKKAIQELAMQGSLKPIQKASPCLLYFAGVDQSSRFKDEYCYRIAEITSGLIHHSVPWIKQEAERMLEAVHSRKSGKYAELMFQCIAQNSMLFDVSTCNSPSCEIVRSCLKPDAPSEKQLLADFFTQLLESERRIIQAVSEQKASYCLRNQTLSRQTADLLTRQKTVRIGAKEDKTLELDILEKSLAKKQLELKTKEKEFKELEEEFQTLQSHIEQLQKTQQIFLEEMDVSPDSDMTYDSIEDCQSHIDRLNASLTFLSESVITLQRQFVKRDFKNIGILAGRFASYTKKRKHKQLLQMIQDDPTSSAACFGDLLRIPVYAMKCIEKELRHLEQRYRILLHKRLQEAKEFYKEEKIQRGGLTHKGFEALCKKYLKAKEQKIPYPKYIQLWGNCLGDQGADVIKKYLPDLLWEYLDVNQNGITAKGGEIIAQALTKNHSLTYLDMGYNSIGDIGAKAFLDHLIDRKKPLNLRLSHNGITDQGAKYLLDLVKYNPWIIDIDLNDNDAISLPLLDAIRSQLIFSQITRNYKSPLYGATTIKLLETLSLDEKNLTDGDLIFLSNTIRQCRSLKHLDLMQNQLSELSVSVILENTALMPHLESIDLSYNRIKNLNSLIELLLTNVNDLMALKVIDFSNNQIDDQSLPALIKLINTRQQPLTLKLKDNLLSKEACQSLRQLAKNKPVRIDFSVDKAKHQLRR